MGRKSYSVDSKSSELSDYELEDALVFKLANNLGGRSEVMNLSIEDALAYLIIVLEKEEQEADAKKWELYLNHISRIYSNPAQDEKELKEQNEFTQSINPSKEHRMLEEPKNYEWNFEKLEELKALQH